MSEAVKVDTSGTWRRGEFVLLGDVFVPVLASLVWLALLVIVFAVGLALLPRFGISSADFSKQMPVLLRMPAVTQLLTATTDLVLLFFIWRIARRVADASLVARYRPARRVLLLGAVVGGGALAVLTMFAIAQLASHSLVKFHSAPGDQLFSPGLPYQYPVTLLTVAVIAPFVEEFYFRGILLSWLGRKITLVPAALVSALIFGLLHFRFTTHPGPEGWVLTGVIALVGLINAVIAIRTKSLWPPFFFHAGYNATLLAATLAPQFLR